MPCPKPRVRWASASTSLSARLWRRLPRLVALAAEQGPADQFAGDLVQGGFKGTRDAGNVGGGCRLRNHEGACGDHALVQAVDQFGVELDGGRGQVAATVVGFETAHVGGQLVVRA